MKGFEFLIDLALAKAFDVDALQGACLLKHQFEPTNTD